MAKAVIKDNAGSNKAFSPINVNIDGVHIKLRHEQAPLLVVQRRQDIHGTVEQDSVQREQHRLDGNAGRLTTVHRGRVEKLGLSKLGRKSWAIVFYQLIDIYRRAGSIL
jgi:hypothetical protein